MTPENHRIEYKRQLTDSIEKEVVAFLNAREGGTLVIGVDDDGQPVGLENCDHVQLALKDRLKNNITPSIMGLFEIIHERVGELDLIRVSIAGGLEKPYHLKKYGMTEKGCFLRVGSSAEPMNREMIETFFGKRVRNTIGRIESPRQDLSFTQLKIYYEGQGLNLNDRFMTNLELLSPEGHPNYAAYLLADENGASLQIAKYAGTDRVDLIENRDFGRCCLVKALYAMLDRVAVENTIYTKITNTNRQEQELIHPIAMREALVNAVVHNDYSYGATAKLEFFSDRAEITSMGGLPYGVNRDDLFGGCSVPRNKEIMRIFRDLNIVEHLGSGIPRILQAYGREAFEVQDSYLRITLPYSKTQGTQPESRPESRPESALANEILKHLEEGPSGKAGLAEKLGHQSISGELNKQIRLLLEQGWIERTLPDKPTSRLQQYRLTSRNNQSL